MDNLRVYRHKRACLNLLLAPASFQDAGWSLSVPQGLPVVIASVSDMPAMAKMTIVDCECRIRSLLKVVPFDSICGQGVQGYSARLVMIKTLAMPIPEIGQVLA